MDLQTNQLELWDVRGIPGEIRGKTSDSIAAWKDLRYGMFIHWGLYSQFGGEVKGEPIKHGYSEQIQMWASLSQADYLQAAKEFNGDAFDPEAICTLAKDAGMHYIVITSKHHDGFCMFDTETTDYNVVTQTPFGKDPLKLLSDECKKQGLQFGIYFSLVDWHLGHVFDEDNNNPIPEDMEPVIMQQLRELMTNYGTIAEVWFDMGSPTPTQSEKFKKVITDLQPNAAVNSRIWNNLGDYRTLGDNQIPAYTLDNPWQTPASIYHETWGYRNWQVRDDMDGKVENLMKGLTSVRARGGNYLLNIGPRGDGSIVPFEKEVLQQIGSWLNFHKQAVLDASPTHFKGQSWGEVTVQENQLFLHVTDIPSDRKIVLNGLASRVQDVCVDGANTKLEWQHEKGLLEVDCNRVKLDDFARAVIRVTLAEKLRMVPAHTLVWDGQKPLVFEKNCFDTGYGFSDEGCYTTLQQTITRQTIYFVSKMDQEITIYLQGKITDSTETYAVELNGEKHLFTGKHILQNEIGPFYIKANELNMLNLTLAKPSYKEKDIRMTLDSIGIISGN